LEWNPAPIMMWSAFCARASAIRYSSFLALLPPKASPVRSSLFTMILGPSSRFVRLGRSWRGVGRLASLTLGRVLSIILNPLILSFP